jgi:hypothetical protein
MSNMPTREELVEEMASKLANLDKITTKPEVLAALWGENMIPFAEAALDALLARLPDKYDNDTQAFTEVMKSYQQLLSYRR